MIDVDEVFEVSADPERVWKIVSNPEEVVGCVPGATLGSQNEDGSYNGSLLVKFGPAKVTFNAKVVLDLDEEHRIGRISAQGMDTQGGTRMKTTMAFTVVPNGAGSSVAGDGNVEIAGRLASMIEGGASVVVKRMTSEFAANLEAKCTPEVERPPRPSLWSRILARLGLPRRHARGRG